MKRRAQLDRLKRTTQTTEPVSGNLARSSSNKHISCMITNFRQAPPRSKQERQRLHTARSHFAEAVLADGTQATPHEFRQRDSQIGHAKDCATSAAEATLAEAATAEAGPLTSWTQSLRAHEVLPSGLQTSILKSCLHAGGEDILQAWRRRRYQAKFTLPEHTIPAAANSKDNSEGSDHPVYVAPERYQSQPANCLVAPSLQASSEMATWPPAMGSCQGDTSIISHVPGSKVPDILGYVEADRLNLTQQQLSIFGSPPAVTSEALPPTPPDSSEVVSLELCCQTAEGSHRRACSQSEMQSELSSPSPFAVLEEGPEPLNHASQASSGRAYAGQATASGKARESANTQSPSSKPGDGDERLSSPMHSDSLDDLATDRSSLSSLASLLGDTIMSALFTDHATHAAAAHMTDPARASCGTAAAAAAPEDSGSLAGASPAAAISQVGASLTVAGTPAVSSPNASSQSGVEACPLQDAPNLQIAGCAESEPIEVKNGRQSHSAVTALFEEMSHACDGSPLALAVLNHSPATMRLYEHASHQNASCNLAQQRDNSSDDSGTSYQLGAIPAEMLELMDACGVHESLKELIAADAQFFDYSANELLSP
ncbi:hypothetical protein WJX79_000630 [Trebouxia sp. C0005]